MTVLREIGRAREFRPREIAPEISLDFAGVAPAVALAPFAASVFAPPAGGFDMAAIRPGQASLAARRGPLPASRSSDAAISAGLHVALLAALLTWATPAAEPAPPEPLTIEIVADQPALPDRESPPPPQPAPPPVAEAPNPAVPPPVEEKPPPASAAPFEPPPAAQPPPPVAEALPPASETLATPPAPEPAPPAPHASVEANPPPASTAAAEKPTAAEPLPAVAGSPPAVKTPPAAEPPRPAPSASPAPRVPKPPAKARPALPNKSPENATAAAKATKLASLPQAVAPAVSSEQVESYRAAVLGRIAAQKRYPEAARERAPHGVAIVSFSIGGSGQLVGASLSQSAGDPQLDAEALATVRRAGPFPPPPTGAPRNFSAPLSYRVR